MKIRKFKEEDAKEVCKIINRCDKEITSKDYSKKIIDCWNKILTPSYILEKSRNRISFVVVIKKKVVGYINFGDNEIKKLHVNPDYHNLGIGKKLIKKIEKFCIKKSINKILVKSTLNAQRFYEKVGFKKIKISFEKCSKEKVKLILMEKKLK